MREHDYEITDPVAGFDEGDVLDVTARFGDWHEQDLQFDPGRSSVEQRSRGKIRLTKPEFERIAEPATV